MPDAAASSEYIIEILVVVDAPSPVEAERYGEQLAGVIRQRSSKRVKNVIVADVRGDDDAEA